MATNVNYKPWLDENGALVDFTASAEASRDLYHIFVTEKEVVFCLWKIIPPTRPDNARPPTEVRDTWEEFREDERLFGEIKRVGGERLLHYLLNIVNGKLDYLSRLPENILRRIILMLDVQSISKLSCTCQRFRELCQRDDTWEAIYRIHRKHVTPEVGVLAQQIGWRTLYLTSRAQLQVMLRQLVQSQPARPSRYSTTIF